MKSVATKRFWDTFHNLPSTIQHRAEKKYNLFISNSRHPSLRFKKVLSPDIYSVRVTQNYRALGVLKADKLFGFG